MKRKPDKKIMLTFALITSVIMSSCSGSSGFYIDIKKEATVTCDGMGLKEIRIENDSSEVTLEGTESIIYFNKKNAVARTSIYGDVINNFELKLKPNCTYKVSKRIGFD
jgi:hypothetical protein